MASASDFLIVLTGPLQLAVPVDDVARLANTESAERAEVPGQSGILIEGHFVPGLRMKGQDETAARNANTWLLLKGGEGGIRGALCVDSVVGIEKTEDVEAWRTRLASLSNGALKGGFLARGALCVIPDLEELHPLTAP